MNERSRVQRLLSPQSIAIVGIAAPGEGEPAQSHMEIMGMRVLANLDRFSFAGDLHLVSRSSSVNDRPTLPAISDLPEGIDVALLAVEAEESVAALKACAERGVASAILYAGGFAERGEAGAAIQRELAQVAHDNGIALLGPNTVGLSNFVDGVSLSFGNHKPIPLEGRKGVALLTQTGGVSGQSRLALESMDVPVAYSVCTGNQAALSVAGLLSFMIEDQAVSVILIFAEQIRDQEDFLRGIER
ncbi:MAG: CoA-binding protein, partial [Sphingobium sp.]